MKQNFFIKSTHTLVAAVLFTMNISGVAIAGSKPALSRHVTITSNADGSGSAEAYFGGVYNGTGVREAIGCGRIGSTGDYFYCYIHNEAGTLKTCDGPLSSYLTQSFSTMSSDARVRIFWNAAGRCTSIEVTHSSEFEDKQG